MAQAPVIMIVRHGEKPVGKFGGVDSKGNPNKHDLIVQGWQRAGALSPFFAPSSGTFSSELIVQPAFLFASAPPSAKDEVAEDAVAAAPGSDDTESKSKRPYETVKPLADKLGIDINIQFAKGQEAEVAAAAVACKGPVLIGWQHESIAAIAAAIPGASGYPTDWPSDRFDIVFVFTLQGPSEYSFSQVPQMLLAGDSAELIQ